jgi:hypothetical protein
MPEPDPNCETCQGCGECDSSAGGVGPMAYVKFPCPDCVAPQPRASYVIPKPRKVKFEVVRLLEVQALMAAKTRRLGKTF